MNLSHTSLNPCADTIVQWKSSPFFVTVQPMLFPDPTFLSDDGPERWFPLGAMEEFYLAIWKSCDDTGLILSHRAAPVTHSSARIAWDSWPGLDWQFVANQSLLSFTTCITFKQTMCVGRLSQCSRGTVLVHTSLALLWFQFISEDFRNVGVKRMGRMQPQKGWNNALVVLKRFCTVL